VAPYAETEEMMPIKRILALVLVFAVMLSGAALAGKADPQTEKEIKDFLDRYSKAYEKKDVEAIMVLIAPDSDVAFVDSDSERPVQGPALIKSAYEREFAQVKSASIKFPWVAVGSKGDVAWITAQCQAEVDTGEGKMTVPAHWTAVLEKRDGKWLLVQSHLSFPFPEGSEGPPEPPSGKQPEPKGKK
jgi:ketosteroid isomerase-like protein